jgi:hypothetical protein
VRWPEVANRELKLPKTVLSKKIRSKLRLSSPPAVIPTTCLRRPDLGFLHRIGVGLGVCGKAKPHSCGGNLPQDEPAFRLAFPPHDHPTGAQGYHSYHSWRGRTIASRRRLYRFRSPDRARLRMKVCPAKDGSICVIQHETTKQWPISCVGFGGPVAACSHRQRYLKLNCERTFTSPKRSARFRLSIGFLPTPFAVG